MPLLELWERPSTAPSAAPSSHAPRECCRVTSSPRMVPDAEMATWGTEEEDATAAGPALVVRVKRELLSSCMTCPICNKLLRDATTISECLHTFCRKCIFDKLNEEDAGSCPVCNIHLGCIPVEKLRADHNLQDLRAKIFPSKKTNIGAPDSVPSITLPVKRKEISLSSLAVNTPRVATQTGLTGRRKKAVSNRAATLNGRNPTSECNKNEDDNTDKLTKRSSSNGSSSKLTLSRRQALSPSDIFNNSANKETENCGKPLQDRTELWKPLNCLVEAANRTKSFKSAQQNSAIKAEQKDVLDSETNTNKTRVIEHPHKSKVLDDKNNVQMPLASVKVRRLKGANQKRRSLASASQTLPDNANTRSAKRITPLWFSAGDPSLPQISTNYLRIKDGSVPVSYIQKYLVTKLNLFSEDEIEITCHDEPVKPTASLHNVVERWLQGASAQKLQAIIGTSAKEFVIALGYRRCTVAAAQ